MEGVVEVEKELLTVMGRFEKISGKEYFRCPSLPDVLSSIDDVLSLMHQHNKKEDDRKLSVVEDAVLNLLLSAQKEGLQVALLEIRNKVNISLSTTQRCVNRLLAKGLITKDYITIKGFCKRVVYTVSGQW